MRWLRCPTFGLAVAALWALPQPSAEAIEDEWADDWWLPPNPQDFTSIRSTTPGRPFFTVLDVDLESARCCPSPFFRLMMEALKSHPLYTPNAELAEVVFFYHDTLRMCEWPHLQLNRTRTGEHKLGCVDAGGDIVDGVSWQGANDDKHSCGWCCWTGTDTFVSAVESALSRFGQQHTFVYFKNSGDNFFECSEFEDAQRQLESLGAPVRYVGFQLQMSQFPDSDELVQNFGVPGVNLLVPLLPAHLGMPEPDEEREQCKPRRFLASFSGQLGYSPIRKKVFELKDKHPRFHIYETEAFGGADPDGYEDVLRDSVFGFVPRGDEHYTFRLTEVLCAGAVPVIIDDDFVSPYGQADIWEWAVRLPESDVDQAPHILGDMSDDTVCKMKKKGTPICHFALDLGGTVDGMLTGLGRLTLQVVVEPDSEEEATGSNRSDSDWVEVVPDLLESFGKVENASTTTFEAEEEIESSTTTTTHTTVMEVFTYTETVMMPNFEEVRRELESPSTGVLRFTVLQRDRDLSSCCISPFFKTMVDTMTKHPDYTPNANEANVIFFRLDTLRMCEWPRLAMKKGAKGNLGCIDADSAEWRRLHKGDVPLHAPADLSESEEERATCGWCCPSGIDVFIESVRRAVKKYGNNHTFVYFKNAQDTFFECNEFDEAKVRTSLLGVDVRFAGFQLQTSQLKHRAGEEDKSKYPIPGVNLLVPLLPSHKDMPEDDNQRSQCLPRKYLASFSGQLGFSPWRKKVFELQGKHPDFHIFRTHSFGGQDPEGYEEVLRNSAFGFVPRGDEHYTFRLTEVLAAGAIPVIIDDDFVAPYGLENLQEWAIRLPENDVPLAPMMLDSISDEKICEMKKRGSAIWELAHNMSGTVEGLLMGLRFAALRSTMVAQEVVETVETTVSTTTEPLVTQPPITVKEVTTTTTTTSELQLLIVADNGQAPTPIPERRPMPGAGRVFTPAADMAARSSAATEEGALPFLGAGLIVSVLAAALGAAYAVGWAPTSWRLNKCCPGGSREEPAQLEYVGSGAEDSAGESAATASRQRTAAVAARVRSALSGHATVAGQALALRAAAAASLAWAWCSSTASWAATAVAAKGRAWHQSFQQVASDGLARRRDHTDQDGDISAAEASDSTSHPHTPREAFKTSGGGAARHATPPGVPAPAGNGTPHRELSPADFLGPGPVPVSPRYKQWRYRGPKSNEDPGSGEEAERHRRKLKLPQDSPEPFWSREGSMVGPSSKYPSPERSPSLDAADERRSSPIEPAQKAFHYHPPGLESLSAHPVGFLTERFVGSPQHSSRSHKGLRDSRGGGDGAAPSRPRVPRPAAQQESRSSSGGAPPSRAASPARPATHRERAPAESATSAESCRVTPRTMRGAVSQVAAGQPVPAAVMQAQEGAGDSDAARPPRSRSNGRLSRLLGRAK